nr:MAG TPA: CopG-like protein [Caudoviricetes sp.]
MSKRPSSIFWEALFFYAEVQGLNQSEAIRTLINEA